MGWFDEGGSGSPVDVVAIMDSNVPALMAAIAQEGALVSFGTTSDGGSLGVTVTLDGRWKRQYGRTSDEIVPWLEDALVAVKDESGSSHASSAPRQRRRRS